MPGGWQASASVTRNQFLLRLKVEGYELTVFPDARAIISGTDDVAAARAVYAKYVGNDSSAWQFTGFGSDDDRSRHREREVPANRGVTISCW